MDSFRYFVISSCGEVTSLFEVVRVYLRLLRWFWDRSDFDCWSRPHLVLDPSDACFWGGSSLAFDPSDVCFWGGSMIGGVRLLIDAVGRLLLRQYLVSDVPPLALVSQLCLSQLFGSWVHWWHRVLCCDDVVKTENLDWIFFLDVSFLLRLTCDAWMLVIRLLLRQHLVVLRQLCRITSLFFELASISVVTCYTFADSDMGCCQLLSLRHLFRELILKRRSLTKDFS